MDIYYILITMYVILTMQVVRDKSKRLCVKFTAEQYKNIYKMLIPAPEQEKKSLLRMLLDRADEWRGYN